MNENDEFDPFFPEESKENLAIEVPAEETPMGYDRIPSGYEPMGEIQLRGRVFSRLAGGQVAWWVLITGWIIFGSLALGLAYIAIALSSWTAWLFLAIAAIPLLLLGRGTKAKLSDKRRSRRSRRSRHRRR
jgi:hypothetical protein